MVMMNYGPGAKSRLMNKFDACFWAKQRGFSRVFVLRKQLQVDNHTLWVCSEPFVRPREQ